MKPAYTKIKQINISPNNGKHSRQKTTSNISNSVTKCTKPKQNNLGCSSNAKNKNYTQSMIANARFERIPIGNGYVAIVSQVKSRMQLQILT